MKISKWLLCFLFCCSTSVFAEEATETPAAVEEVATEATAVVEEEKEVIEEKMEEAVTETTEPS